MKRNTRSTIALVLMLVMLAGIGGTAQATAGESGYLGKYDPENVLTISWLPQCDRPVDPNSEVTKAIEELFNIKIDYIYIDRERQRELLGIRLASNDIPDGWRTEDGNNYRDLVRQGVLAEIPMDLLEEVAPNLVAMTREVYAEFGDIFEFMKEDGKLYGIPVANLNGSYMLMNLWRDDWLKAVGIDKVPETVDEAEAAFYAFANDDPDGNGVKDTYALSDFGIRQFLYAYGGEAMNSLIRDGRVTKAVLEPEFKEGVAKLVQFYADGLIDPEFSTHENKGQYWASSITFQNGVVGFSQPGAYYHVSPPNPEIPDSTGSLNYEQFKALNPDGTFTYGKALKGPYPEVLSARWGNVPSSTFVMGANVDEEEMIRILQIQEAVVTNWDTWLLVSKGVEGVTYETNMVGDITDYTEIWNPDGSAQYDPGISTNGFIYMHANNFEFNKKAGALGYVWAEEWATPEALGCTPWTDPIFGSFDSEVNDAVAACRTRCEEALNLFVSGQRPFNDAEWDKFIGELEAAGILKWQAAAQSWYDENF